MAELGSGNGTDYPAALDTDNTLEADGSTLARADVPNDMGAAIVGIENELGTNPAGTLATVKAYLQTEHNTNGTHKTASVVMIAGSQTITGEKLFTETVRFTKGTDVASATTLTLGAGNYFDITGTTTVTGITSIGPGVWIKLHFDGALQLTHHATNFVLLGGANITTVAGDEYEFIEYDTGKWRQAGTVADNSLSTAKYKATSVTGPKLSVTPASTGSALILAGATTTPAAGVYNFVASNTALHLQLQISAVWQGVAGAETGWGLVYCDGTNMRFNNSSGSSSTLYWQKF